MQQISLCVEQQCDDCAMDKAKQGNVSKQPSTINGERLFLGISSPSAVVLMKCANCFWFLMIEETMHGITFEREE